MMTNSRIPTARRGDLGCGNVCIVIELVSHLCGAIFFQIFRKVAFFFELGKKES